jgi:carboxyvinyl-carboxyphosphonate phosphorylmutase
MNWGPRRARLRALLAGPRCVFPASLHDPLSARLAQDLGFEMGMLAGSVASLAILGAPDLILLTLSEFAGLALRINRATALPLLVDADHGYGNALNVRRTVEELEIAGVAALTIEDTLLPTPFGGVGETRLVSIEEGRGKMAAALAGRGDPALVVAARTGAMAVAGVDDTIARGRAYAALGVDALFLTGVRRRAELDAIAAAVPLPLMLGTLSPELEDADYLSARGVRIALQGHLPFMAALQAAESTLQALRAGTKPAAIANTATPDLLRRVTREADYRHAMAAFLGQAGG